MPVAKLCLEAVYTYDAVYVVQFLIKESIYCPVEVQSPPASKDMGLNLTDDVKPKCYHVINVRWVL